jgi:hypothetical protein
VQKEFYHMKWVNAREYLNFSNPISGDKIQESLNL